MSKNRFSLKGKTALVTGGSKGIGKAIALAYAEAGAELAITARESTYLEQTRNEIVNGGGSCLSIEADLLLDEEIARLHQKVTDRLGNPDILVNNAGMGYMVALSDITYQQFHEVLKLNTWATLYLSQLCYPAMKRKKQGVIINMASSGGIKPDLYAGAYSASKSALIMLTKQIACEWGPDGIRCVAICPGLVRTEMSAPLVAYRESTGIKNLVNRIAEPAEVAGMALLLASDAGSYCQGSIYSMDGGSTVSSSW